MTDQVRVVVCHGERLSRVGLRSILERSPGVLVVADIGASSDLDRAVAEHRAQVVVVEEGEVSALDVSWAARVCAIVLFSAAGPATLLEWFRRGVRGVVDISADDLGGAVLAVGAGRDYLSPTLSGALFRGIRASRSALPADASGYRGDSTLLSRHRLG